MTVVADGDNRAVVERYVEAFFAPNGLDALESTLAADAEVIYPQSGERFRGRQNVRAHLENYPEGGLRRCVSALSSTGSGPH